MLTHPSETDDGAASRGGQGMARVRVADACVQSDSIKGLAQSIAKPAYHRLVVAEPTLRRAVPTLIIAFLVTICIGAIVQVIDQSRLQYTSARKEVAALADLIADRLERPLTSRQERPAAAERLQASLPGLIPSWGIAAGRHVFVVDDVGRILARSPESGPAIADQVADILASAEPTLTPGSRAGAAEVLLPNGASALAALRPVKAGPQQLIVVQELPGRLAAGACGAVDHAVGDHRLRRPHPRLRLPLAIDPRPRRRPDQRRGARTHRYSAQSRPLRPVGLGPVARPDLLVAIDVHDARPREPQRPAHLRRGQRTGPLRRHRPVSVRQPVDLGPCRSLRRDIPHAPCQRPLDLAARAL